MFDIAILRKDRLAVEEMLKKRGAAAPLDEILSLDEKRVKLVREINRLREERNRLSEATRTCPDPDERQSLIEKNRQIRDQISAMEENLRDVEGKLNSLLYAVPNMLAPDVPPGEDESANVEVRRWGTPRTFPFEPRDHADLGEILGLIDTARGAKVWGTRTYFLTREAVFLEFALVRFALDFLTAEGFIPVIAPVIVREDVLYGSGHYPFFRDQIYRIGGENLGLVGTSEIPLAALHAGEILDETDLPLKYAGFSPCYRTEVGSGGKDVRGLMRTHHFDKVEMFVYDKPETSDETHEWMVSLQERIYQTLGIPYRVVKMCAGDLGPIAYRKYDLEFWRPAEKTYREITSCSTCTDYQARGLNVRYRPAGGGKLAYVHTLNGTAIAIGRTIAAIMENYQESDGSVVVPEALRQYMPSGVERISRKA